MSAFKAYFADLKRRQRTSLIVASVCAAGVSIAATTLLGLSGWFLAGAAIAGAAGGAVMMAFNYLLPSAAIRGLAIARTVMRYFERLSGHTAALRTLAELRPWLFERVSHTPLRLSRGEASARLVQDVGQLENAVVAQSHWASALGGLIAALILTLLLSPVATLIAAAGIGALIGLSRRVAPTATTATTGLHELGALKNSVHETLPFLPDIAAYRLSERFMARLSEQEAALRTAREAQARSESLPVLLNLSVLAVTLSLIVLTHAHAAMPMLALGLLVTTVAFEATGPLLKAMAQTRLFAEAEARVAELGDAEAAKPAPRTGSVLRFGAHDYDLGPQMRLLIHGASGSGKTRLIEALIGLRPMDEVPGLTALPALRFSLSPQDAPVLNGTIGDTLLMALSPQEIAAETPETLTARVWAALEAAQLKARVVAMPKGLHQWIGDGGVTLSGGERKRLSLARALLRQADVLVLDEPTEGLDATTEAAVTEAVEAHLKRTGQGLILISHRPGPRRLCDQDLAIDAAFLLPRLVREVQG
ncbi:ATP-binding cassette domain-containing protein [Asticcacaulis excentricus]|uniref:Transport ATP-binding protein CydC n=1 Tax=Asticcacaulis excentricus TaxID=78587 RepID=A0A3G9FZ59_9CAUL|nr:ATP-binding cassette domain-containing protein [Asticcacaulis excentricus]BBF79636.1 transport ATP-binding protein CydC [Asticcacaulis excentricus]